MKYTKPVYRATNVFNVVEYDGRNVHKLGRNEQHVREWYDHEKQPSPVSITWIGIVETKWQNLWI